MSNPKGAWVEIDGEPLSAVTPTQIALTSGKHRIRMGKAERRDAKTDLVINSGANQQVNLNLGMDPHGGLTLKLRPASAKVEIIGTAIKYTAGVRLPMGEYTLQVSRPGYITQDKRITIQYGDNTEQITLARGYGKLAVQAIPADSFIDVTPAGSDTQAYSAAKRLPAGKVSVTARAMGYRTQTKTVNLTPAGQTVRFNLKKLRAVSGAVLVDELAIGGNAPPMIIVPAGEFTMGNAKGSGQERPARSVQLTQPFAVGKYEVSIGEFVRYAKATGAELPKKVAAAITVDELSQDSPIANVSHQQATKYADWLSIQTGERYRLPTEAEWEYAARAGSQSPYFFGDQPKLLCDYANVADQTVKRRYRAWTVIDCNDGQDTPRKRGQYAPNAFGLYDTHGNVSEWVADCGLPEYSNGSRDGTQAGQGQGCSSHGHRGGSWDSGPEEVASSYRKAAYGGNGDRGIRLVREL
jgi:formylglycine-generating enzyme required for sulfatase activity